MAAKEPTPQMTPDPGYLPPLKPAKEVPPTVPFFKLMGPGWILVGLSIGSGELIMWPTITAQYGYAITWGMLLGITFQFFWNTELVRWTVLTGESWIQGCARLAPGPKLWVPLFVLIGTYGFIWPGWAAAAATSIWELVGKRGPFQLWAVLSFAAVLLLAVAGKIVREPFEKVMMVLAIFFNVGLIVSVIVLLTRDPAFYGAKWGELVKGLVSFGSLPKDLDMALFGAAVAYAGAGGIYNIYYSYWARDKGWGMGANIGKIAGLRGEPQAVSEVGYWPEPTTENIGRLKAWLKLYEWKENFAIWYVFDFMSLLLFIYLAGALLHPKGLVPKGFRVAVEQGQMFSEWMGTFGWILFMFMAVAVLWSTHTSILEGGARMWADTIWCFVPKLRAWKPSIRFWYYTMFSIYFIIGLAIILSGMRPLRILVIGANIQLAVQWLSAFIIPVMYRKLIPEGLRKELAPSPWRWVVLYAGGLFWLWAFYEFVKTLF